MDPNNNNQPLIPQEQFEFNFPELPPVMPLIDFDLDLDFDLDFDLDNINLEEFENDLMWEDDIFPHQMVNQVIRIDPPNCSTYGEWLQDIPHDHIARPILHRRAGLTICAVRECEHLTYHDCGICLLHHPVQEVDNFPCFVVPISLPIIEDDE